MVQLLSDMAPQRPFQSARRRASQVATAPWRGVLDEICDDPNRALKNPNCFQQIHNLAFELDFQNFIAAV